MKTMTSKFPLGPVTSEFAGFTYPRYVATLPKGSKAKRLEQYLNPVCGPYFRLDPKPVAASSNQGITFYLDSDFMPGLRWKWCDDVTTSIRHTGWFCDDDGCGDKIRGLVMRLPKGRGFLAGWSMGESMISFVEASTFESEMDAAHAADSLAESAADEAKGV